MRGRSAVGFGGSNVHCAKNVGNDRPISAVDAAVREPEHAKTLRPEPSIPLRIMRGIMERSIGLDDQPVTQTYEV